MKPAAKKILLLMLPLAGCLGLLAWLLVLPKEEKAIAAYSTGLRYRTKSQLHNLQLACRSLNGVVIPPGAEFSFNRTVGPWTQDRGYRKAPVSFSGEKILDWGGGVCQLSTTLYNAALLAGLEFKERHHHYWPASYVPPGQDAAVAYPNIDLRFRNTLDSPVRITARVVGELALIQIYSRSNPPHVRLEREVLEVIRPTTSFRFRTTENMPTVDGKAGYEIVLYRDFTDNRRREVVSRDSYPARNKVIWIH